MSSHLLLRRPPPPTLFPYTTLFRSRPVPEPAFPHTTTVPAIMPLPVPRPPSPVTTSSPRSEEHTSELQSRENLVCRLLLEKKKNTKLLVNFGKPNNATHNAINSKIG